MKAIYTLVFTLVLALSSYGQQRPSQAKVTPIAMEVVLVKQFSLEGKSESRQVARLYRRPNARVNKALSFTTIKNRPQLA